MTNRPVALTKYWVFLSRIFGRNDRFDYVFDNIFGNLIMGDIRIMLSADDDAGIYGWDAVVVFHRHLGFAIRSR